MERKITSLAVFVWIIGFCDDKIESLEKITAYNARPLEGADVLKCRNLLIIHEQDLYFAVDHSRMECGNIRRGSWYKTVHVTQFNNVWKVIEDRKCSIVLRTVLSHLLKRYPKR